ncbi:threonine--tRNA ligase [Metallumcola ferriviriculae]|uniref:Threonine--tRNA ligase n=1 Tax=Metallumcola ferriviriculae TaxID=3039180 RepID=A0AAU0URQ2_9FIRM|nr:threonine--tRNA ligase [Desulfitibacteraceae bacterium MK1]
MSDVKITFPDGSVKEFASGVPVRDVAKSISGRLAKEALAAEVNGRVVDIDYNVTDDSSVKIFTFNDEEGKRVFRHSSAHLMAEAVKNLFPHTVLGIGPAIAEGFYYDFDSEHKFTPDDLEKIEKEMQRLVKEKQAFVRREMPREEALGYFNEKEEKFKVELIKDLPDEEAISFYSQGDFTDLCAGPHVPDTGYLKAFKLLSVAGAYWRGDENNPQLQRIYGTSFQKKSQLEEYLHRREEAKKRDHRKLGTQLELFTIVEEGPGFPIFLPKGMVLRNQLEDFWRREHTKAGYLEIKTPIILNRSLWENSGHWEHYQENMYFTQIDEQDFAIKPMNCPGGMLVYRQQQHSYRDLPLRTAELGLVHRHELSGVLHGLMRVRAFTQDDAHIFMLPEQITDEIKNVIDLVDKFYNVFGFKYHVELSTKPEKAMGSDEIWEETTASLETALKEKGMEYVINEGDGAFYGPKIDFHLEDCLGRTWQCGTIQLDSLMPEKFDLTYIGEDGQKHRPVMIHRVVFGSIERFIGILIEHYAGAFPSWLAPVQVKILPIAERFNEYAFGLKQVMAERGIRVEVDERNEKVGYKIRQGQMAKVPYMLIVGEREEQEHTVSVRQREKGDMGAVPVNQFIEDLLLAIAEKRS